MIKKEQASAAAKTTAKAKSAAAKKRRQKPKERTDIFSQGAIMSGAYDRWIED